AAAFANRNFLAHADLVGRNVHLAAVHCDVAMADELASLTPGQAKTQAVNHGVEAALQLLQKHLAGDTFRAHRLLEVIAELTFLGKVDALGFLLLAQLQSVSHDLSLAVFSVLAGREVALLDRTFIGKTFWPLEEQLHALAAAQTTHCIFVTCQFFFSYSMQPVYRTGFPSSRLKIVVADASKPSKSIRPDRPRETRPAATRTDMSLLQPLHPARSLARDTPAYRSHTSKTSHPAPPQSATG